MINAVSAVICNHRTGEELVIPAVPKPQERIPGTGFVWYDTLQEHIMTETTFRNCGYRVTYSQYDSSPTRGCRKSCHFLSTTFGFLTHSDIHNPEIMQGTRAISFQNCGRRFSLGSPFNDKTVSGRAQNWLDVDGSASGRGVPTFMVSGFPSSAHWWIVDDSVGYDPQGPLRFIDIQPKAGAPLRGLGHVKLSWDVSQHSEVGKSLCGNGNNAPCPSLGFVRHAGRKFSNKQGLVGRLFSNKDGLAGRIIGNKRGLAITAVGEIIGPVNGYGWIVELKKGAPRKLRISAVEVLPETPLLISIAYPAGTTVNMTANAAATCWNCKRCAQDQVTNISWTTTAS
jgi:hypothetical protein